MRNQKNHFPFGLFLSIRALTVTAMTALLIGNLAIIHAETLSGQITPAALADGSPAGAGITVFASGSVGSTIGQGTSTVADTNGNFSLDLGPGSWSIRLDHKAAAQRGILTPIHFTSITPGNSVTDFKIEVFRPSIEVHGTLKSDLGDPIPNITFSCSTLHNGGGYDAPATTDANGEFSTLVFAGEWNFSAFGLPAEFQRPRSQRVDITEPTSLEFIAATGGPRLTISPETLPDATAGESYSATLSAEGGSRPHVWSVAPGSSLPPNLEITEFGGKIQGVPTASGSFRFTIEVSTFSGSITGQKEYTLLVQRDTTPPTVRKTTPGRVFKVRDNSVLAIHFSEPMFKIDMSDPTNRPFQLQWQHGTTQFNRTDIDLADLFFEWNDPGDTLYIGHQDVFPRNSQTWTLNPPHLEDKRGPMDPAPFRDTSGNEIAINTKQTFKVTSMRIEPGEEGEPETIYRDVDQVWLVKNHTYDDTQDNTPFRLGTFNTVIHLPENTWNTVRSATVTSGDGETRSVDYFGLEPAGRLLNLTDLETTTDSLDRRYPNGQYTIELETVHDGKQILPLRFQGNAYPTPLRLVRFCQVSANGATDSSFLLKFREILGEPRISYTHLMISKTRGQKVINLRETPGGAFESIQRGNRYGFVIPPDTLEENTTYHGFLRRINIVDTNHNYENALVSSAYTTTTEFVISTSRELPCGSFTPHMIAPIDGDVIGQFFVPTPGEPLPPRTFFSTNSTDPAILTLAGDSRIELAPDSECILDTSDQATEGTTFELNSGRLLIEATDLDLALGPLTVTTPHASIELSPGSFEIQFDGEAQVHSTNNLESPVLVQSGTNLEFGPEAPPTHPVDNIPPQLSILRNDDGTLTVHWEDSSSRWSLESSPTLSINASWTAQTAVADPDSDRVQAQLSPSEPALFLRLRVTD